MSRAIQKILYGHQTSAGNQMILLLSALRTLYACAKGPASVDSGGAGAGVARLSAPRVFAKSRHGAAQPAR
eukprot:6723998-Lingulodinium_polyedra.AAC.1